MHAGFSVPASVTGKPQAIGGSEGRFTGPGRGLTMVTVLAMRDAGMDPSGATVAIQGFGKVGGCQRGAADRRGDDESSRSPTARAVSIAPRDSIWLRSVTSRRRAGTSSTTAARNRSTGEDVLTLDVDLLVPAALEAQVSRAQRRPCARKGGRGGRKRAADNRGGRRAQRARRAHPARHPRQRRRRRGVVLRVGAGHPVVLLGVR